MKLLIFLSAILATRGAAQTLPDGPGKDTFEKVCADCHGLDRAINQRLTRPEWQQLVDRMGAKGANGSAEEMAAIVNYLAKNFGKEGAALQTAAAPQEMPEGAGKQIILRECTGCHPPSQFTQYHHSKEEWQAIVVRMAGRARSMTQQDIDTVTAYFAANFPKIENTDASKVNLNKASAPEITNRLGLTTEEAEAIVHYRETHGDFKDWHDLLIIYGVPGRKIQALQDRISF